MKKILLILLFMSSFAFADYQFIVENTTMVSAYFNIFNAIGALFQNNDYIDLLRLTFLLGGFFVFAGVIMSAWEGKGGAHVFMPYVKYLIFGVTILTMIFSNKETVWVTTNNLPSYCASTTHNNTGFAVDMPSVLGFFFTTTNKVGRGLTELAESAFALPANAYGTSSMTDSGGYLESLKKTIKVLSLNPDEIALNNRLGDASEKANFSAHWTNFFNQCVYATIQNKGAEGDSLLKEIKTSKNIFNWSKKYLDYKYDGLNSPVGDSLIYMNGATLTCKEYFAFLEDDVKKVADNSSCLMDLNGGVLELMGGGTASGTEVSKMSDMVIQSGLLSALSASKFKTSIGIAGADYASGKTRAEANMNNLSGAQYMSQMLPYIQMTMRGILYGFFPFVIVVVLLPGGLNVLKQYAQTLIWVELWGPTASVVNMFVNLQVKTDVGSKISSEGLTSVNAINLLSEATTIAGVGAMLYLTVPALTWLILKGSGHMLGNVTSGIGATFAANMGTSIQSEDLAHAQVAKKNGTSIAEQTKLAAQRKTVTDYAENLAFREHGGVNGWTSIANKKADGSYETEKKLTEKLTRKDYANKGLNEALSVVSDSKNLEKHGYNQLLNNLTNKKNEDTIKTKTRMDSIKNKDSFFAQESKQDFETKEKVEASKYDLNGDGKTSNSEIAVGAKLENNKAKGAVLSESIKQDRLVEEGKKLHNSNTKEAHRAVNKGENTENIDKNIATAIAFSSGAQVKSDMFNKTKDIKNIESLDNNGYGADDMGNKDASNNLKNLEELNEGTNTYAKDVSQVIETQSGQMVSKLRKKGVSEIVAYKTVMTDMAKRKLYSGKLIQGALGSEINGIEAKKQKALKANGIYINKDNYESSKKAVSHLEKMANNTAFTKEQRNKFTEQTRSLKDKISSYDKINNEYESQKVSKVNEYQKAGLIQISSNGEIKYRDTVSDINNMSQEDRNLYMAQVQGASNAQKTSFVDMEGMDVQKIKNIHGNDMTNISKATQEWSKTGRFTNDISFHAVKDGYIDGNTMGNINKTVEVGKNMVAIHSLYKGFMK